MKDVKFHTLYPQNKVSKIIPMFIGCTRTELKSKGLWDMALVEKEIVIVYVGF